MPQMEIGDISIHAPLAGRDRSKLDHATFIYDISIHAPLAGRDGKSDEFSPADLRK